MANDLDPATAEALTELSVQIQELTGLVEAQRFLIEDLYALGFTDADAFGRHAEYLLSLPASGAAPNTDPRLIELRREARERHLHRTLESVKHRISDRGG